MLRDDLVILENSAVLYGLCVRLAGCRTGYHGHHKVFKGVGNSLKPAPPLSMRTCLFTNTFGHCWQLCELFKCMCLAVRSLFLDDNNSISFISLVKSIIIFYLFAYKS